MQKLFYNILVFILAIGGLNAQIKLVPLEYNPEIDKYKSEKHNIVKQRTTADTISLPFIEDFAGFGIYPDNSLWLDSEVFVNNSYPDTPIFRGVVTFDCLNKDLRAATTLPSNTTLSSTSDIFNVETDSETISFEITSSGGIKTLTRQGQACASYINSIVVTTANNTITTTVNTALIFPVVE